ncbi:hypothetical protein [Enemella dayhoffiae]|uniref:hypothetical protein n=1 Tax=Enemella dayhoffiae TaxID=2016507 RepID=UPI0038994319
MPATVQHRCPRGQAARHLARLSDGKDLAISHRHRAGAGVHRVHRAQVTQDQDPLAWRLTDCGVSQCRSGHRITSLTAWR